MSDIYLGNTEIEKAYIGDTLIYEKGGGDSGSGDSGSDDDWVYVNCNTLIDLTNPGAKAGSRFYAQFTNSSNLIVEFMPPYATSTNPTPTWTTNKVVSLEIQQPADYLIRYRIKSGVNMAVGDVGTLTITNSSGTVTYTFKLVKTFSDTAVLNTQSVDDGADIEKLNVSGGSSSVEYMDVLFNTKLNVDFKGTMFPSWDIVKDAWINNKCGFRIYDYDNYDLLYTLMYTGQVGNFILYLPSDSNTIVLTFDYNNYQYAINNQEGSTLYGGISMHYNEPCFVKGTKITLSNGEKKAVEDITYKDSLLVWDFDLREKSQAEPLWITKTLVADNYKLVTLDDGKQMKLVGTGENCHRLFCVEDGEFVYANNMIGKTTIYEDGTQHKVVSCEVINDNVEYYNIITYHHMNLYAEDVLTSCRYSNMYPIEDMRYVKDDRAIRPQSEYNVEDKYYYGLRLGESLIELYKTLIYINNLKHFEKK